MAGKRAGRVVAGGLVLGCGLLLALPAGEGAPAPTDEEGKAKFDPGGFGGRVGAHRNRLLEKGGGNKESEKAVADGLRWLALHQAADGRWTLHDFHRHARSRPYPGGKTFTCDCRPGTTRRNDVAATAFALLPFLGAGYTHKRSPRGAGADYRQGIEAGLKYLLGTQGKDGAFGKEVYGHCLATIAVCEAYGLTADRALKEPAQSALDYLVGAQDPSGGGWRYAPRQPGDTSVTGWVVMALKSGQMAGLRVPKKTFAKAGSFLDSVESDKKGGYGYIPGAGESPALTAVGLLCRQYLGTSPRNPGLLAGVRKLRGVGPGKSGNLYYEYYATQVMHHMGGDNWRFWNLGPEGTGKGGIRDTLIAKQDKGGPRKHEAGSWPTDSGSRPGGRMMATSLSLLTLEVYYRHIPLYRRDLPAAKGRK
jgi:hypothetical protein